MLVCRTHPGLRAAVACGGRRMQKAGMGGSCRYLMRIVVELTILEAHRVCSERVQSSDIKWLCAGHSILS